MNALGGTLDRYVFRRMASVYGLCMLSFVLLFLVVDGFSRLDEFMQSSKILEAQGESVWSVAIRFYATKIPRILSLVGPYLTLFAGIATLLSLARSNEIVPMLNAGRGAHRVLLPVYVFGLAAVGMLVVLEERVLPKAIRENEILDRIVRDQGKVEVSKIPHLNDGPNRFAASRWYPKEQKLTEFSCQQYTDPSGRQPKGELVVKDLLFRKHPTTGRVGWYPVGGVLTPSALGPGGRVLAPVRLPPDVPIAFSMSADDITVLAASGEEGVDRRKLEQLHRMNPRMHHYSVDLATRTTRPVSSFVLLLLGIPFVMTSEKRSIAWGLGLALCVCIAYFGADFVFREIGMRGELNPMVAVWVPPVLFTAVALSLMDRVTT